MNDRTSRSCCISGITGISPSCSCHIPLIRFVLVNLAICIIKFAAFVGTNAPSVTRGNFSSVAVGKITSDQFRSMSRFSFPLYDKSSWQMSLHAHIPVFI